MRQILSGCIWGEMIGWVVGIAKLGVPLSGAYGGHEFVQEEEPFDAKVEVLRCEKCGETSTAYARQARP